MRLQIMLALVLAVSFAVISYLDANDGFAQSVGSGEVPTSLGECLDRQMICINACRVQFANMQSRYQCIENCTRTTLSCNRVVTGFPN